MRLELMPDSLDLLLVETLPVPHFRHRTRPKLIVQLHLDESPVELARIIEPPPQALDSQ